MADRDKIIEKIKNLRAKSMDKASTEAEAMAAAEMAARLLAQHDVKPDELKDLQESVGAHQTFRQGKVLHPVAKWTALTIAALTETTAYQDSGEVNFVGVDSDVMMAVYLIEMLTGTAKRGWMTVSEDYIGRVSYAELNHKRKSYYQGFSSAVARKMKELAEFNTAQRAAAHGNGHSSALVIVKTDIIARKLEEMGVVLHENKGKRKNNYVDPEVYARGRAQGENININRPFGANGTYEVIT